MRTIPVLVFILAGLLAKGQGTGTIRMLVDPGHDFSFIVDGKQRLQQREVKLTEGLHDLSVWAPERQIVDTTFYVIEGRTTDLVLRLPYSAEYLAFREQLGKYQVKRRWVRTVPMVALASGLVWTGVAAGKYGKAKDALDEDQENYNINVDPAAIRSLKEGAIPDHNEAMKDARTNLYLAMGFTALSAGATYYLLRRTARWERPLFDDKEKLRFDGMSWVPDGRSGMFMAGLTWNIGRP